VPIELSASAVFALANLACVGLVTVTLTEAAQVCLPRVGGGLAFTIALVLGLVTAVGVSASGLTVLAAMLYGVIARMLDGVLVGYAAKKLYRQYTRSAGAAVMVAHEMVPLILLVVSLALLWKALQRVLAAVPHLDRLPRSQFAIFILCACGLVVIPSIDQEMYVVSLLTFPLGVAVGIAAKPDGPLSALES
jgi:hypothetical protein